MKFENKPVTNGPSDRSFLIDECPENLNIFDEYQLEIFEWIFFNFTLPLKYQVTKFDHKF